MSAPTGAVPRPALAASPPAPSTSRRLRFPRPAAPSGPAAPRRYPVCCRYPLSFVNCLCPSVPPTHPWKASLFIHATSKQQLPPPHRVIPLRATPDLGERYGLSPPDRRQGGVPVKEPPFPAAKPGAARHPARGRPQPRPRAPSRRLPGAAAGDSQPGGTGGAGRGGPGPALRWRPKARTHT